ncbi:MAG: hypothetical protein MI754_02765 [Chromatiales bacterium]|nr:hypothetical protein [Chromatiales bacterium]
MGKLIQQINLYQPRFRREEKTFSLSLVVLLSFFAVLLMGAIYGYGYWQNQQLAGELLKLQNRYSSLKSDVERMRTLMPKPSVSDIYQRELARLQLQRSAGNSLLNNLANQIDSRDQTFSEYFAGLARQSEEGLWLEALELNREGDYFALQGKVIDPELLPQFLQRLEMEKAFRNKAFRVVNMSRAPDSNQISFDLKTESREEGSE